MGKNKSNSPSNKAASPTAASSPAKKKAKPTLTVHIFYFEVWTKFWWTFCIYIEKMCSVFRFEIRSRFLKFVRRSRVRKRNSRMRSNLQVAPLTLSAISLSPSAIPLSIPILTDSMRAIANFTRRPKSIELPARWIPTTRLR